jgi:hypothetical protein
MLPNAHLFRLLSGIESVRFGKRKSVREWTRKARKEESFSRRFFRVFSREKFLKSKDKFKPDKHRAAQ